MWAIIDSVWSVLLTAEAQALLTGAGSGGSVSGGLWWWQRRKAAVLPAFPSHHEALATEATSATRFFAAVHDLTMAVTAAWNASRSRTRSAPVEQILQRDELRRCKHELVTSAEGLRAELHDYAVHAEAMVAPNQRLSDSWSYRSRDNYRTEYYTTTSTDSDGNTTTQTHSRQVYESTDHWFTFERSEALAAQAALETWLEQSEGGDWVRTDIRAQKLDMERLDGVQRGFLKRLVQTTVLEDPEAEVDDTDLAYYASQWLLGPRIDERLDSFVKNRTQLRERRAKAFEAILASDASYHYRTGSRSHGGPHGFQQAQMLLLRQGEVIGSWRAVDHTLTTCVDAACELLAWAEDPASIESDREYADLAINAYQTAFPDSDIDLDQLPSHGLTVGAGLGTAALLGGGLYALHPLGLNLLG